MLVHMEIDPDRVCAFLVFSNVHKIKWLAFARFLILRAVGVGNQRLASLIFRERFEKLDNLCEPGRIHRASIYHGFAVFPAPWQPCQRAAQIARRGPSSSGTLGNVGERELIGALLGKTFMPN